MNIKEKGRKEKEILPGRSAFCASIRCETGFLLWRALLPNSPRPFSRSVSVGTVPSRTAPLGLSPVNSLATPGRRTEAGGGIDWRSVARARANLATGESRRR